MNAINCSCHCHRCGAPSRPIEGSNLCAACHAQGSLPLGAKGWATGLAFAFLLAAAIYVVLCVRC